ncbi:hypothetical protein SLS60_011619 [Paraconiothyrium brasiliense]|uniref:Tetratricopeptide repeat protein n=1 Tax=Paraconiothyrium brasiliense TaxID=300254 RepID=A0ABR3QIQ1_9PLEO
MSIESRLREANEVLTHILDLLADLNEVATELLDIVSGKREGSISVDEQINEEISEVHELREAISGTITRLFRVSILIRQAAPTDLFAKALSRKRYCFDDQFDIAHVGEKYRKLDTNDYAWLRQRLGRAVTQSRHYLSYIRDHHEKLGGKLSDYRQIRTVQERESLPNDVLAVVPTVFKRHLAGHLEQLALFALPIDAATDDDTNSNAAIEKERSKRTDASQRSALTFASSRGVFDDGGPEENSSTSEALRTQIQDTGITARPEHDASVSLPSKTSKLEDMHGVDQLGYLARMVTLSETVRAAGQWQDAEKLEVQVLEKSKQVLGPEHPDTLASMRNLALALEKRCKYVEAEVMYTEMIQVYEKVLGHEHSSALTTMSHLVRVLDRQDKYKEAEPVQRQLLATYEKVLGEHHTVTLMNIGNLASLCASQKRFDEAEKMFLRELQGTEEALGPDHVLTLNTANELGNFYVGWGQFEEAEGMYQRALQGREKLRQSLPETWTA